MDEIVKSEPASLDIIAQMAKDSQIQKYSDDKLKEIAKSGDWFPRLQLCGGNTKIVKKKLILTGHYALVISDDDFEDLGESVDVIPMIWRPKALDMSGENPVSCFDETSDMFKDIQARSFVTNSSCCYGPEFLVWVPKANTFGTFLLGSKTSRGEAKSFVAYTGKPCTLTYRTIETTKFIWECPVANPCTTPLAMPDTDKLTLSLDKFNREASAKAPEKADDKVSKGRAR